jgi:hypothetical protein
MYAEGGAWATVYDFHRWLVPRRPVLPQTDIPCQERPGKTLCHDPNPSVSQVVRLIDSVLSLCLLEGGE